MGVLQIKTAVLVWVSLQKAVIWQNVTLFHKTDVCDVQLSYYRCSTGSRSRELTEVEWTGSTSWYLLSCKVRRRRAVSHRTSSRGGDWPSSRCRNSCSIADTRMSSTRQQIYNAIAYIGTIVQHYHCCIVKKLK